MSWIINKNFNKINDIKIGDIIHLRNNDGLGFLLKGIVLNIDGENITAKVESSFSLFGEGQILLGQSIEYVHKELVFDKSFVHKVICIPET